MKTVWLPFQCSVQKGYVNNKKLILAMKDPLVGEQQIKQRQKNETQLKKKKKKRNDFVGQFIEKKKKKNYMNYFNQNRNKLGKP